MNNKRPAFYNIASLDLLDSDNDNNRRIVFHNQRFDLSRLFFDNTPRIRLAALENENDGSITYYRFINGHFLNFYISNKLCSYFNSNCKNRLFQLLQT